MTSIVDDTKGGDERIEELAPVDAEVQSLSDAHREFLMHRWGTLDLDPVPDMSDADPYNWPKSTKVINLVLVAFNTMIATFTTAAISSSYTDIAADLHISLQRATYLTSLQVAFLGFAPLLWRPIANRYGRRPVFLISLVCSGVGNVGCAVSPTFATQALCRAIVAFFISPAAAIGSAVVAETFFRRQRARYMGVWTLMYSMGVPMSPFIFGFVAVRVGYRWIYWILAIVNSVQFVLYLFLGPETLYIRNQPTIERKGSSFRQRYFTFGRIDPTPFTLLDFVSPLRMCARFNIFFAALSMGVVSSLASLLVNVEIPQLFAAKFDFNAQQLGYQFLGLAVGSVLGEQIAGRISDAWMAWAEHRRGAKPDPEWRLWLTHIGIWCSIVGLIVFLVRIEQAAPKHYNVTPIVGAAIASAGCQIMITITMTYGVDCFRAEAASVGVVMSISRQTFGFTGPFWFVPMFNNAGLYGSAGIVTGLLIVFSLIPIIVVQVVGKKMRERYYEKHMMSK